MADNRKFLDQTGLVKLIEGLKGRFVEQDKLVATYLTKTNLKAANVAYENTKHMSGVETVEDALDVLAANVVRQEDQLAEDGKAMQVVEGKIDDLQAQVGVEAKDGVPATGLVSRIGVLEELIGQNKEGATGSFATRVADLESEVDVLQAAIADGGAIEQRIQDNEDAIKDINDAENGILAQAKDYADGLAENYDAAGAATQALVDAKAYTDEKDTAMDARVDALEAFKDGHDHQAMIDRIADNEEDIARLDGAVDVEGSVKKQIKDAIDEVNGAAETLAGRVKANEDKLAGLEEGCTTVQAAIDKAEADAKAYADQQITALVDSAPDAMNTLNELATAISANKGVYDAYVEQHAQAMATMKSELQTEIDTDVKAEADRAKAEEAAIRGEFAAADDTLKQQLQAEIDTDVKVEADRAMAAEEKLAEDFAAADTTLKEEIQDKLDDKADQQSLEDAVAVLKDEIDDDVAAEAGLRKAADDALAARIAAFEGDGAGSVAAQVKEVQDALDEFEEAQATKDQAQDDAIAAKAAAADLTALEEVVGDIEEGKTVAGLIAENAAAAKAAQDEVDALELVVGKKAADGQEATGIFLDIANLQADVDQNESNCDAAIKAEEEARKTADQGLDTRVKVFEAGGAQDVAALAGRVSTLEAITVMSESEITAAIGEAFGDTQEA